MNIIETLQNYVVSARKQKQDFHNLGLLQDELDLDLKINESITTLEQLGADIPQEIIPEEPIEEDNLTNNQ